MEELRKRWNGNSAPFVHCQVGVSCPWLAVFSDSFARQHDAGTDSVGKAESGTRAAVRVAGCMCLHVTSKSAVLLLHVRKLLQFASFHVRKLLLL